MSIPEEHPSDNTVMQHNIQATKNLMKCLGLLCYANLIQFHALQWNSEEWEIRKVNITLSTELSNPIRKSSKLIKSSVKLNIKGPKHSNFYRTHEKLIEYCRNKVQKYSQNSSGSPNVQFFQSLPAKYVLFDSGQGTNGKTQKQAPLKSIVLEILL